MKLTFITLIIIFLFGCEKSVKIKKEQVIKITPNSIEPSIPTQKLIISAHYLAIGYFDDKNNLKKIDRFLDGKLLK